MSDLAAQQPDARLADEVALCARASGLTERRVSELALFSRERGMPLVRALVERAGVDEAALLDDLAKSMGMSFVAGGNGRIPAEIIDSVSAAVAVDNHVMPLGQANGRLRLACCDPFDWKRWDELSHILSRPLEKVLCPHGVIDRMLKTHYGIGADTVERLLAGKAEDDLRIVAAAATDLGDEEAANEPTVVNLVNRILTEAIRSNATDIHLEPYEHSYRVRYRIDGMLEDVAVPVSVRLLRLAMVSRIKIMSSLDITEKRLPQDGRCQVSLAGQDYDLRISILPGIHGEAVVIRLQSRKMVQYELGTLGFATEERERVEGLVRRPHGLILVTGPTGSGKTTTLYACLNKLVKPEVKIITVEDPVEYWMSDIVQMQVKEEIGFTFALALRHMLRHDPDIMLVGEIRDRETAEIAVRCSLTGHLVFSTLHTNDAAGAATRLVDIGIEPYLVASSLQGVLAQRLVRKVCPHCAGPQTVESLGELERRILRDAGDAAHPESLTAGSGCERCRFTGYRGRTAVGEVIEASGAIRSLIQRRAPAEEVRRQARDEGSRGLRESAILAACAGRTTMSEVLRATEAEV